MDRLNQHYIKIGFTDSAQCHYLPSEQERLGLILGKENYNEKTYELLLENGFRRSGNSVYRPECQSCTACHSIRLPIKTFTPSNSQKKLQRKSERQGIYAVVSNTLDPTWFSLYEKYICARHQSGNMYPPQKNQFLLFSHSDWLKTVYLQLYNSKEQLIAVAITDTLPKSLSAFYSFYDPTESLSLGTLCVLQQVILAKESQKDHLYLGYQIDNCSAMNYKSRFKPHQMLVNNRWQG